MNRGGIQARFFDGRRSQPFEVRLEVTEAALRILRADTRDVLADWPAERLRVVTPPGGGLAGMLACGEDDARLAVDETLWAAEVAPLLRRHRKLSNGIGIGGWIALCVAAVLLIAGSIVYSPAAMDAAAQLVPPAWEERLGTYSAQSMVGNDGCPANAVADAALQRLVKSLDAQHHDFKIYVSSDTDINALTVPGHNIVILDGLLRAVATQGQLAAVLAHETGHAYYRHPLRMVMESLGARLLLGLVTGDAGVVSNAANAANQILLLRGNRDFESQADTYGMFALEHIGQPPRYLGDFLKTMPGAEVDGVVPEWLLTHPNTDNRIKAMQAALQQHPPARGLEPPAPVFSEAEWQAIKHYCGDKPGPEKPAAGKPKAP